MERNSTVVTYECELNTEEKTLPPEPSHPAYRGMHREGKWCYFFFSHNVDEYFHALLRSPPYRYLLLRQRFEFPLSSWQSFAPQFYVGGFHIVSNGSITLPRRRLIRLAPSISFGSGIHPSTQACLTAMEKLFTTSTYHTVMDIGTGSGILAFGALLLGASIVIATDINTLAIREARHNARLNNFSNKPYFIISDGLSAIDVERVSLIVMNLEWPSLKAVLKDDTWWACKKMIVCGFPRFRWKKLLRKLELSLFFIEDLIWVEDWGAVTVSQLPPDYSQATELTGNR